MRYIKLTTEFIKNNFLKLFLCAILPAALFSFAFNPAIIFRFFSSIKNAGASSFAELYVAINDVHNIRRLVVLLVTAIITAILLSVMTDIIQRKMRYGSYQKIGVKSFFSKVNDYFLPMIKYALMVVIFIGLASFVITIFAYFWMKFSYKVATVLIVLTVIVVFVCVLILFALLCELLPNMTLKGYGFFVSFKLSVINIAPKFWRVFGAILLPLLFFITPLCINMSFHYSAVKFVNYFLSLIFYLFAAIYYMSFFYATFFDIEDIEREDLSVENYGGNN